jgi:ribosome-binding factor A
VTGVEVTADLRHATVLYTAMGDERARKATAAGLRSATAHLRQVIGRQVRLKILPELAFAEDSTMESAQRIDHLIEELHRSEGG